jgi:hypothetical protein
VLLKHRKVGQMNKKIIIYIYRDKLLVGRGYFDTQPLQQSIDLLLDRYDSDRYVIDEVKGEV